MADKTSASGDAKDSDEDKTSEENEDLLKGIADEDEDEDTEEAKDEDKEKETKPTRPGPYQKQHWRDRFHKERGEREQLEARVKELEAETRQKTAVTDAEKQAEEYIRTKAKEVAEEVLAHERKAEKDAMNSLQTALDEALEDHPALKEDDLLTILEEFEEDFHGMSSKALVRAAVKIAETRVSPKRKPETRSTREPQTESKKKDDSKKTMWQVAQDVISDYKTSRSRP